MSKKDNEKTMLNVEKKSLYLYFITTIIAAKATLSADDIEYLKANTRYDEQEIKEWYR